MHAGPTDFQGDEFEPGFNLSYLNVANLKDECPVNALRDQNLAGGHLLGHEIRLVFVSLSIWAILGIN